MEGCIKSIRQQLQEERRKNEALTAALSKALADMGYLAMMAGIELDEEEDEPNYEQKV